MIQLVKGQDKEVIVTLTEKTTFQNGSYQFEFTHETTKEKNILLFSFDDDLSDFKYRYNKFLFENLSFQNWTIGKYTYEVYEIQAFPTYQINLVESGKMDLNASSTYTDVFNEYSTSTSFKTYGG